MGQNVSTGVSAGMLGTWVSMSSTGAMADFGYMHILSTEYKHGYNHTLNVKLVE